MHKNRVYSSWKISWIKSRCYKNFDTSQWNVTNRKKKSANDAWNKSNFLKGNCYKLRYL